MTVEGAEGDVVWLQEDARHRLHGCTHNRSIDKVNQHIDAKSLPAACR